jgi:uncharacterized protein (TIGR00375 family)
VVKGCPKKREVGTASAGKDHVVNFTADLHVHLGRTRSGRPVKIGASSALTLDGAVSAALRKGITLIGVVDFVPEVIEEACEDLRTGASTEGPGGGLEYRRGVTVLPGIEVEIRPRGRKAAHFVMLFQDLRSVDLAGLWLRSRQTNPNLSSQLARATAQEASDLAREMGATFWPAHSFTPHKGYYGGCASTYGDVFERGAHFKVLELGLSADTEMARMLPENRRSRFVTASDCHGPETLAREFMLLNGRVSFEDVRAAANHRAPWPVAANYGLDPRLGKYHRTACPNCGWIASVDPPALPPCPVCGHARLVTGVKDRLAALAMEQTALHENRTCCAGTGQSAGGEIREDAERPLYVYQVPLAFLPGIGKQARARLCREFGDESFVLHRATREDIARVAGEDAAALVIAARTGDLDVLEGGGGQYGRVLGVRRGPA